MTISNRTSLTNDQDLRGAGSDPWDSLLDESTADPSVWRHPPRWACVPVRHGSEVALDVDAQKHGVGRWPHTSATRRDAARR